MAIGYPKPSRKKKKNKYRTSNNSHYSQSSIDVMLRQSYKESENYGACECCGNKQGTDHDHTISQKRCKELGKTELIWDSNNWSWSCRDCHHEYESYKSGNFQSHNNVIERMTFVRDHDLEGFNKRMFYITDKRVIDILMK